MIHRLLSLIGRFRSDERGAFLALFGVCAVVLIALSGAVIDYVSVEQARTRAQTALDSAALALQSQIYTKTPAQLSLLAQNLLLQSLGTGAGWKLCDQDPSPPCTQLVSATPDTANGSINLEAKVDVPLYFVALVGIDHMQASVISAAARGSSDIEVALALDTTGSMAGQPIKDLRAATTELIDIIVQDAQTPAYSKVAIVPYSMGVNAGAYADFVRGSIIGTNTVSSIAWSNAVATISGATKANPVVITTSANHNYVTNDYVYIAGVVGMTEINKKIFKITKLSDTTFSLQTTAGANVDGTHFNTFTTTNPAGRANRCLATTCELVVTTPNAHGYANNDLIFFQGVGGLAYAGPNNDKPINGNPSASTTFNLSTVSGVTVATQKTFVLSGRFGPDYGAYTSGGTAYCIKYGCEYYRFTNANSALRMLKVSTCVTERVGPNAYTDAPPNTAPLGLNYPSSGNGACLDSTIQPLSINKTALKQVATDLEASGFTSGHIGLAWAWYMLSPEFAYLWPAASRPAPYRTPNLLKVVVLMTDGEFNNAYCNGVISKDSTGGASASDRNSCKAPNGLSDDQADEQCRAIKAAGIILYTVGFNVGNFSSARTLLTNCATDPSHAYFPNTGTSLKDAFKEIGANLSALRVTR